MGLFGSAAKRRKRHREPGASAIGVVEQLPLMPAYALLLYEVVANY
jgi:hypothetical protein